MPLRLSEFSPDQRICLQSQWVQDSRTGSSANILLDSILQEKHLAATHATDCPHVVCKHIHISLFFPRRVSLLFEAFFQNSVTTFSLKVVQKNQKEKTESEKSKTSVAPRGHEWKSIITITSFW